MSAIDLAIVRRRLRVIGTHADADLQQALDGAEQEACRYLNRTQLPTLPQDWPDSASSEPAPSSDDPVAPDVVDGVLLLVLAEYRASGIALTTSPPRCSTARMRRSRCPPRTATTSARTW